MLGKYIIIEGQDGAGKSTIHKALKKPLGILLGDKVQFVKEPYYKQYIDLIKKTDNVTEKALLFASDRAKLMEEIINPAIFAGITIVSDRSYISNIVYQGVFIPDLFDWLCYIQPIHLMPNKDLVILFTCDPEISATRLKKGWDGYQSVEFLTKVRDSYLRQVSKMRDSIIIDTGVLTKKEALDQTYAKIEELILC